MTIDDIYKSIAQNIVDAIPGHWDESTLHIERPSSDVIGFKGGYVNSEGYQSFKFRNFDRRKLTQDCHSLHSIIADNGSNQWNRATFTLYQTGQFNIEFEWDQLLHDESN